MKTQITIEDTGDGQVNIGVEALEGEFSQEGETPTAVEVLTASAFKHIMKLVKGEE